MESIFNVCLTVSSVNMVDNSLINWANDLLTKETKKKLIKK